MKYALLLGSILMLCIAPCYAQQQDIPVDEHVVQHLGKKMAATTDQDTLRFLSYYTRNGFTLTASGKDLSKLPDVLKVPLKIETQESRSAAEQFSSSDVNFLSLEIKQHCCSNTYYRVGNTDSVLVVLPMNEIITKFNADQSESK